MKHRHEVLESKTVFRGKILEVVVDIVRLPDGSRARREIVRHPGAVAVVALLGEEVLLVRQNRHAVGEDLLEIPAGKLEPGEEPAACARRELEEETGFRAGAMEPLGSFLPSPGFSDERIYLFLGLGLERGLEAPSSDEGEPISTEWLLFSEALASVRGGVIQDSKTIVGLLLADERLRRGF